MNWPKIRKELMLLTKLGKEGKKRHILIGRHLQALNLHIVLISKRIKLMVVIIIQRHANKFVMIMKDKK